MPEGTIGANSPRGGRAARPTTSPAAGSPAAGSPRAGGSWIGHNRGGAAVEIEVRLFNSIARFSNGNGARFRLELEPGTTVGEVLATLGVPPQEVFLVWVNGRDITPGVIGAPVRTGYELDHGDVLALSGPVPYSWGYGSPVV